MLPIVKQKTIDFITQNDIKGALSFLQSEIQKDEIVDSQLLDQIVLVSRSYSNLQQKKLERTLDFDTIQIQENRISKAILELTNEISNRRINVINDLPDENQVQETGLISIIKSSSLLSNTADSLIKTDNQIGELVLSIIEKEKERAYAESDYEIQRLNEQIEILKEKLGFEKDKYNQLNVLYEKAKEENIAQKNFMNSIESLNVLIKEKDERILELQAMINVNEIRIKESITDNSNFKKKNKILQLKISELENTISNKEVELNSKYDLINNLELKKAKNIFYYHFLQEENEQLKAKLDEIKK